MKAQDIQKAGVPPGPLMKLALSFIGPAAPGGTDAVRNDKPNFERTEASCLR